MTDHPHRQDVWGDDPEEADASEVVEEIAAESGAGATVARSPLDRLDQGRRPVHRAQRQADRHHDGGVAVLLAGLALLVLPGPGWLLIFAGLAILWTEYVWAQPCSAKAKTKANKAKDAVLRKKTGEGRPSRRPSPTAPTCPDPSIRRPGVSRGRILIGTSSWTDPTLVKDGNFYPPGTTTAEGPAEVLRLAVPVGGGGLHLLLPAAARRTPCCGSSARPRTSRSTSRRTRC